jgi:hypothetical protein
MSVNQLKTNNSFNFSEIINKIEDIEEEDMFSFKCLKCKKESIGFYSMPNTYTICYLCR